jgi:rhamnosyltransferase
MHSSHPLHRNQDEINKIGAIVVLFEWRWDAIAPLIASLVEQTDVVCVVDNGDSLSSIEKWPPGVHYVAMGKNAGIAAAQNRGAAYLRSQACDAALLMDQDSQIPKTYVADLRNAWVSLANQNIPISTIGAAYRNVKTACISDGIRYNVFGLIKRIPITSVNDPIRVDYVIASGSLVSLQVWQLLAGMDEALFTYWVDIEWGLRSKRHGFYSYLLPKPLMEHSIGKKTKMIFGRKRVVHDDFRQYYIVRNQLLLLRYSHLPVMMRLKLVLDVFFKYLPGYIYCSAHPWKSIKHLTQAIYDGALARGGRRD